MKILHTSLMFLIMSALLCTPQAFGQGHIEGVVRLELEEGRPALADRIRVLLTSSRAVVPPAPDLTAMDAYAGMEAIRDLHMAFFIDIRKRMAEPAYLVDSALTSAEGNFQFSDLPPGNYFVIVTFPAMIEDYKVAWQVPATVKQDETVTVVLDYANMAVPTYTRNKKQP